MAAAIETYASRPADRKVSDADATAADSATEQKNEMYLREYIAWFVVLIAAVEAFVGLDLPQIDGNILHWSLNRVDLSGMFLNVSGSLLEGFFASWDEGWVTLPNPPSTSAPQTAFLLQSTSGVIRDSFLAAYMSWVAMVEHGGELSRLHGSPWVGATYCALTIVLGLAAHAVGIALAWASAHLLQTNNRGGGVSSPVAANDASTVRKTVLVGIASYVALAFVRCYRAKDDADIFEYTDGFEIQKGYPLIPSLANTAPLRLAVSIIFSTIGAHAGNCVGENINANALFTCLNLLCHALLLNMTSWSTRSHLLSAFMGSFCGSGSSFGGMCTGVMDGLLLNRSDTRKHDAALWSLFLHLAFAVLFVYTYILYGHYGL